jgi:hypothetical protein
MSRVLLAVMLLTGAALAGAPSAGANELDPTHKVTISGELVNHWTVSDDRDCAVVGGGTVSTKFKTIAPKRVRPIRNPHSGKWQILVPVKNLYYGMRPEKASGSLTRVDNTTLRPPADPNAEPCEAEPPKAGCGTFPLKKPFAAVGSYDKSRIALDTIGFELRNPSNSLYACLDGDARVWDADQELVGGGPDGQVLLKMPSESAFRSKKTVTLTGTTHKKSSFSEPDAPTTTNDITRKVTVTFKPL